MNQKYFIVTGSYEQFRDFRSRKIIELCESGIPVHHSDFIYATEDTIRGHRNPKGWFWGTWRERRDIDLVLIHLRISHGNQNVVLDKLHLELREWKNSKTV